MTIKKPTNGALRIGADAVRAMLLMIVMVLYAVAMICAGVAVELVMTGQVLNDGAAFAAFAVLVLVGWLAYKGTLWLGGLMNKLVDVIQKPDP